MYALFYSLQGLRHLRHLSCVSIIAAMLTILDISICKLVQTLLYCSIRKANYSQNYHQAVPRNHSICDSLAYYHCAQRDTQSHFAAMTKSPHVAIIGAGFSGLSCAEVLTKNGAKVTVFEARNRVGGRVSPTCLQSILSLMSIGRSRQDWGSFDRSVRHALFC